ncbi:MAG: 4Fe-4S dicluster domain-containing protein [Fidelibacterota bacterium]
MNRRSFIKKLFYIVSLGGVLSPLFSSLWARVVDKGAELTRRRFGMGIQIDKCIGCGRCVVACKTENSVPREPLYFRTWVERYQIKKDKSVVVQCNEGGAKEYVTETQEEDVLRSFFVPKLCNHCDNPPCAQVCPVGATFQTEEGIVLVDANRCIGCSYCIQACPYGARYMHPVTHTADKCTLCFHRIKKGLLPACVEVCPTQARVFGDLTSGVSPLTRLRRMEKIHVLKPSLNTEPKVFYTALDGEVT